MQLKIRSGDVNRLAERLPAKTEFAKTEAVRTALDHGNLGLDEELAFRDRPRQSQGEIQSWSATGLDADKAFFDDLSGEA